MLTDKNRIKYAFLIMNWAYEKGKKPDLEYVRHVPPEEYEGAMEGNLFCPVCFTNLIRVPKNKALSSNGRKAYYAHVPKYRNIPCDLRSTKPEGKFYSSEEEAAQAIENNEFIVISSFQTERPNIEGISSGIYNQTPIEDQKGPLTNVPIARHDGRTYRLPSKISTVNSLCRNFDENIYKYYHFPNARTAVLLTDVLLNIQEITETDDVPKLYYGVIEKSFTPSSNPKPNGIRMTRLKYLTGQFKDFYLKDTHKNQQEKGISDASTGRIVLFWGKITENGIGLCISRPGWGEYALLPEKYNYLFI
jgi:hypothetical protein